MQKIIIFLVAVVSSATFTYITKSWAKENRLLDIPNKRSSHSTPKPKCGGISVALIMLLFGLALYFFNYLSLNSAAALFGGGLIVAGVGFWDDIKGYVHPKHRLFAHIVAGFFAMFLISGFPELYIGPYMLNLGFVGFFVGVFLIVGFVNIFNFMDGIDGISGSQVLFFSLGTLLLKNISPLSSETAMLFLLALAGVSLGFLIWNWAPSKIFLGDVGSCFLGFIMMVSILIISNAESTLFWPLMILIGVYIVDTSYTLFKRIIDGQKWYEAHRTHAYQKAAIKYESHKKVVKAISLINLLWLLPLAVLALTIPAWGIFILMVAYFPLVVFSFKLRAGEKEGEKKAIFREYQTE